MYKEELELPDLSVLEDEMSQLVVEDDEESDYMPTPMRREHFGLQALNRNISMLTDGRINPIRFQLTQPLAECAKSTQYYIKRKAAEVITASLNCIAPGQSKELFDLVTVQTAGPEDESPGDKVVKELISLYEESTSWYTKMTVLSVFVKHYTKAQLQQMIPGLTIWRIDQARKHAAVVGAGVSEERQSVVRYRLDSQKLDHFLDFISCPHYIQDVAYGTKKLEMSTGEVLQIPNLVRTVVSSRMITLYQNCCREMEFEPLARSTLFAVLKVWAASKKKSLSGLDSVTSEGSLAFDTLEAAVHTIGSLGMSTEWVESTIKRLRSAKVYLKTDYKLHVTEENPCADHCQAYALSSDEKDFHATCSHQHNIICERCEDTKSVLKEISSVLATMDCTRYQEQKKDLEFDIEQSSDRVLQWKAHVLRAINQERAKSRILDNLEKHQCLIVMDWAMKWLPKRFRETQAEWFGKKGISWHVSACITRTENTDMEFEVRTLVHIFDACNQDWFAVASVLENVASEIVNMEPRVKELFLRSDNAGCYHNAALLSSAAAIIARQGLVLKDYSFSEANSGKDVCDRKIAPLKAQVERYINEGHDVTTAAELKEAIDSYRGVKGCWAAVCELDQSKQMLTPVKWAGISQLNNFQFESGSIKVWRAFHVGAGSRKKALPMTSTQQVTGIKVLKPFRAPDTAKGALKKPASRSRNPPSAKDVGERNCEETASALFSCPEEGCTKVYRSNRCLVSHLDFGKHQYKLHGETQYDHIRRQWAAKCSSLKAKIPETHKTSSASTANSSNGVPRGWALKARKFNRFTEQVKNFLLELFLVGEETGRKVTPLDASRRIRTVCREGTNQRLFDKEEWLTAQQIANYFSRLATLKKTGKLPQASDINVGDQDLEPLEREIQRYNLRERVKHQLTL